MIRGEHATGLRMDVHRTALSVHQQTSQKPNPFVTATTGNAGFSRLGFLKFFIRDDPRKVVTDRSAVGHTFAVAAAVVSTRLILTDDRTILNYLRDPCGSPTRSSPWRNSV